MKPGSGFKKMAKNRYLRNLQFLTGFWLDSSKMPVVLENDPKFKMESTFGQFHYDILGKRVF